MQLSFDHYLSNRIGLGRHQYLSFSVLSMIEFMAGFQEIFVGIQIKILANEWSLSETQQMTLGGTFFLGVMIGNGICSIGADKVGRRGMLLMSQSATVLVILINSFAQSYTEIVFDLFAYGLLFGICMPISQIMISEIVPLQYRGRYIVLIQLVYILGILYLTICCFIFLDSYDSGDWRMLLRFNIIPALLCLAGSVIFLRESARLHIAQGNFDQGFLELDSMGLRNNPSYVPITEEEKTTIKEWRNAVLQAEMNSKSLKGLVEGSYLRISLTIWAIFITFNVISSGVQMITPYILQDSNNGFGAQLASYSAEIPAILLVCLLIDNEKYGGRPRCTCFGLVVLAIVQLLIWNFKQPVVFVGQIFQRFSIRVVWSCLNALPAESYSTVYRSSAVGAAQGLGKLASSISPFPILWLYYKDHYLPFLICSLFSLITLFLVLIFPRNATLQPLDASTETKPQVPVIDKIPKPKDRYSEFTPERRKVMES